jgi:hypothetical protein
MSDSHYQTTLADSGAVELGLAVICRSIDPHLIQAVVLLLNSLVHSICGHHAINAARKRKASAHITVRGSPRPGIDEIPVSALGFASNARRFNIEQVATNLHLIAERGGVSTLIGLLSWDSEEFFSTMLPPSSQPTTLLLQSAQQADGDTAAMINSNIRRTVAEILTVFGHFGMAIPKRSEPLTRTTRHLLLLLLVSWLLALSLTTARRLPAVPQLCSTTPGIRIDHRPCRTGNQAISDAGARVVVGATGDARW